ncbi:response regulator [Paraburkholderia madseniana]|uniref:response regulator n=1 Tax=Paraburkholderia madseniana TaxID=2599607 RepID=UPI001F42AB6A|nr:response regulator [Paraburkholderia madseniana]
MKRAQNRPDALRIVESFNPDVALIDISMPVMDGIALAQLLRLRAKLVAMTGYSGSTGRLQGDERVFECHLIKPLSLDDLAEVLQTS